MSDDKLEQFDDELLSAYLDDELTPDERLRVQERLAVDPAARQSLEQLRAVSQAVKDLPRESLGEDLGQTVLRQAERTMLSSPSSSKQKGSVGGFKLPFGRSARGWAWASLAVAAALMLMFVQENEERNDDLPDVAAHRPAAERSEPELRALPEPSEMADGVSTTDLSPSVSGPAGGRGGPSPTADAEDLLARAMEQPEFRDATESDDLFALVDEDEVLVIHVNMRQEAFRTKAFDMLLLSNGIAIEEIDVEMEDAARETESPTTLDERSAATGRGARLSEASKATLAEQDPGAEQPEVDVVVVDAPSEQIETFMAELDADEENYVGVSVAEEPASGQSAALKSRADWSQYNRGRVSPQQTVGNSYNQPSYGQSTQSPAVTQQLETFYQRSGGEEMGQGRALRVKLPPADTDTLAVADLQSPTQQVPSPVAQQVQELNRSQKRFVKDQGNLRVLFVLSAEDLGTEGEAASSPASADAVP